MIKVIMTAFVAIAIYATTAEQGYSPVAALAMGTGAALGVYYIYLKIEEMEAQYEERHKCIRRKRESDARSATNGGACRRSESNRNTYARYAQPNSDKAARKSPSATDTRAKDDSDTHLPIRKVCGVLSYDYYNPNVGDRKEIL